MKSGTALIALLFAALLVQGYARTASLSEGVHLGIVEAVFEERLPGIFVRTDSGKAAGAWVHVQFPEPLADGRAFAVAAVPPGLNIHAGDVIQMRFAGSGDSDGNIVTSLVVSRVEGLIRAR